jgi:hypothetical protein
MRSSSLEIAVFGLEAAITAGVVAVIHARDEAGQRKDDWLWREIMLGCVISGAPAMLLSRSSQRAGLAPSWQDYERWAITGFCTSAAVVVPWMVGRALYHRGRVNGYDKAKAGSTHDQGATVERAA